MTQLKVRYTLQIRRLTTGSKDSHGNPVPSWGNDIDWEVYGYASGDNNEPGQPNRDVSSVAWTVYAPMNAALPTEDDQVKINGDWYEVEGVPQDFTHDPWGMGIGQAVIRLGAHHG